ncbi:MAG: hypothetical protein JWM27_1236 [Gemmatimonadetes bacterium]|nr:hypothetical protein [Gemmatimonadota bacterium]
MPTPSFAANGRAGAPVRGLADDGVPEPPAATGQYPGGVWDDAPASASSLAWDAGAPEPPSPTGQYPDDVWAPASTRAYGLSADDDVPEPEAATGQYPDDPWAAPRPESAMALSAEDDVPEPESATGQYPDDVWAAAPATAQGLSADDDVAEPDAATGQYPDDVWASARPESAMALEAAPVSAPAPNPSTDLSSTPATAPSSAPPTGAGPVPVAAPPASAPPPPTSSPTPAPPTPAADAPAPVNTAPAPVDPTPPSNASAPWTAADHLKEPDYSDELLELPDALAAPMPTGLTLHEMYRVVRAVATPHSGDALYSAVATDADYSAAAPECGIRRFGLQFGLLLFTQESGRLGSVLRLAERRNPRRFDEVFGAGARELLAVTSADSPERRLSPVAGRALDDPEWIARFQAAGAEEELRNAQNEEAIAHLFRPMLPWALALGLDTDRGLAFVLDAVVARGLGGGVRWTVNASGLLADAAELDRALRHLGHGDLRGFQASTRWLAATGHAGPETTAALLGALRRHGGFALPSSKDMQARLTAAADGAARRRLERLARAPELCDAAFGAP